MNAALASLLDHLHEGAVLLSPEGEVRHANAPAREALRLPASGPWRDDAISSALSALRHGRLALPFNLQLRNLAGQQIDARLLASPAGRELMVLLHPPGHAEAARSLGELINQHCRAPMQSFLGAAELAVEALAARSRGADADLQRVVARAVTRGKVLADKLSQLSAIAQAAAGHPITADERVLVKPLVEAAAHRANALGQPRGIHIFTEGLETELPPLYGSELWLSRALFELIASAIYCGAPGADVLVSVAAHQGQVRLAVRVAGSTRQVPGRSQTFSPFFGAAGEEGLYARALGLGLPFARWVFERHGGTLALRDEASGIAEFSAQLPVALPAQPAPADTMAQTRRYAEDLASLLGGNGRASSTSSK